jgi:ATP-binding cassette subfamily C protein CydC
MSVTLKKLFNLISPYIGRMTAAISLGFLTIASGIGLMSTSAYIIARAALQPPLAELQVAIAGVRAFGIGRGLLRYAERLVSHDAALRILSHLRVWIYDHVEPLESSRFESYRSGDLLARLISDVNTLENFFVRALAPTAVAIGTLVTMTIFMGAFHSRLALIFFIFFLLDLFFIPLMSFHWTGRIGTKLVLLRSDMFTSILDGLQGSADLIAFNQTEKYQTEIHETMQKYHQAQHLSAWASGFSSALSVSIASLSVIGLIIAAIPIIQSGSLSGIDLAVLVLANFASYEAAFALPNAYQELNLDIAAGTRIFDLTESTKSPSATENQTFERRSSPPEVHIRALTYTYRDRLDPALHDLSFTIQPGDSIAIVGPSGSGKTTLVDLLMQFQPAAQGQILIDGRDIRSFDPQSIRQIFSVIPQRAYLFHTTLRENLLLGQPGATDTQLIEALKSAQSLELLDQLPSGLDTQVGEHGYQLSAGERQRISIARALLKDAPILILDEATSHLDAETEARLWRSLNSILGNRSSLIISHRLIQLERCTQILVLDKGQTIQRGDYKELLSQEGWFSRTAGDERVDRAMQQLLGNM